MTEIQNTDETYMREALKQAKKALALGEVPIGCVIVHEGKIIARGYNRRNTDQSTLSHAEITAIRKAGKVLKDWRLEGCTLYVTLEPCQMCAGAIVQARIPRVVMGSMNPKAGCAGSIINLLEMKAFNHQVEVTRDVLREECSAILQTFFSEMREKQRAKRAPGTLIRSLRGGLPGYTIVEGSEENAEDIQKLMAGNEEYFRLVKEKLPTLEGARESYTILPPNTSREQKTFAVFYKKGKCTAVLDFIQGYPKESVGFIGLFMLAADCQGKGIGKKMFRHIREAAEKAGLEKLRLGCYAANEPGRIFWEKQGFQLAEIQEKDGQKLLVLELALKNRNTALHRQKNLLQSHL